MEWVFISPVSNVLFAVYNVCVNSVVPRSEVYVYDCAIYVYLRVVEPPRRR